MSVQSTPNTPEVEKSETGKSVKPATPDIILFDDDSMSIEMMTDLIFEDIGGQELINIARHDIINGQNIIYQPIKNIRYVANKFNPKNIIPLQNTSEAFFDNFSLKLENYLPIEGNGPNGSNVYMDESGNLVVEVVGAIRDEQVEIEILNGGELFDDTIY
jgi:hypothetical protein